MILFGAPCVSGAVCVELSKAIRTRCTMMEEDPAMIMMDCSSDALTAAVSASDHNNNNNNLHAASSSLNHLHHRRRSENERLPRRDLFGASTETMLDQQFPLPLNGSSSSSSSQKGHRRPLLCWGLVASHKSRRVRFVLRRLIIGLVLLRFLSYALWVHGRFEMPAFSEIDTRMLDWQPPQMAKSMVQTRQTLIVIPAAAKRAVLSQDSAYLFSQSPLFVDQKRTETRRQRTRPSSDLSFKTLQSTLGSSSKSSDLALHYYNTMLSSPTKLQISHYDWIKYCNHAGLDSSSSVWITNILTSPTATAFALLIARQCGVKSIVGIDHMFPNIRMVRIQLLQEKARVLTRSIDDFMLIVPFSGLRKPSRSMDWTLRRPATHIVHFDTASTKNYQEAVNKVMSQGNQRLFRHHIERSTLEDMLSSSIITAERHTKALPRMLHVTTQGASSGSHPSTILSAYVNHAYNLRTSHLVFPSDLSTVGPLVRSISNVTLDDDKTFYTDDVMAFLLMAMEPSKQKRLLTIDSRPSSVAESEQLHRRQADLVWKQRMQDPFETTASLKQLQLPSNSLDFIKTYGVKETRFPCASSCRPSTCVPSVFDAIQSASRTVTRECQTVLYLVILSQELEDIKEPRGPANPALCRVAFISGKSILAKEAIRANLTAASLADSITITEDHLKELNGKLAWNRWNLIWLPQDDAVSINDAEYSLLRIEPSGMFSSSVKTAIYVESPSFASALDTAILAIAKRIDRPAVQSKREKERRPGTGVARFIRTPSIPARRSTVMVGEPTSATLPKSVKDFVKFIGEDYQFPARQLAFYETVAHLVQTNDMRPEREIRTTQYFSFPYQWISMSVVVHDLKMPESRDLRCSWYDESLFWGGNPDAEELSFAYLLARRRIEGGLGSTIEGEDESWNPMLVPKTIGMYGDNDVHRVVKENAELFVRIVKRTEMK
jgi:hypothetical protein